MPGPSDERFGDVETDRAPARDHRAASRRRASLGKYELDTDAVRLRDPPPLSTPVQTGRGYVVYRVKDGVRHIFDIAVPRLQPVIEQRCSAGFLPTPAASGADRRNVPLPGRAGPAWAGRLRSSRVPCLAARGKRGGSTYRSRRRASTFSNGTTGFRHGRRRLSRWSAPRTLAMPRRPGSDDVPRSRASASRVADALSAATLAGRRRRARGGLRRTSRPPADRGAAGKLLQLAVVSRAHRHGRAGRAPRGSLQALGGQWRCGSG